MNIGEMANYIDGEIIFGEDNAKQVYSGAISINTKTSKVGDIFIALKGSRSDGHAFVEEAQAKGVCAVIVEEDITDPSIPVIKVKSSLHALLALAKYKRSQFNGITIGITGSAGKTTVKEMLSHVLSQKYMVDKNLVNYNNQIGMSLSILSSSLSSDIWIMEVGISEAHDMEELGDCLRPDIAIIINSGSAHESGLGKRGVAYHKASLIKYLSGRNILFFDRYIESCAFVCNAYEGLVKEAKKYEGFPVYLYSPDRKGSNTTISFECVYIGKEKNRGMYRILYKNEEAVLSLPYMGSFMSENISAIYSVALYLGLNFEEITQYISSIPQIEQRNNIIEIKEHIVIDDSYNSNPVSMRAMVEMVAEYKDEYSIVLLLGDMNELGLKSEKEHEALGEYIAKRFGNIPVCIFWKGIFSEYVVIGLNKSGFKGIFLAISSEEEFLINVRKSMESPTVFLCKGSRSNMLEKYVNALCTYLGVDDVI